MHSFIVHIEAESYRYIIIVKVQITKVSEKV